MTARKIFLEKSMQNWLQRHGEQGTGKHWKGDIHRRFIQAHSRHKCPVGGCKPFTQGIIHA